MKTESTRAGTRRISGVLFIVGTAAFGVAATVLSMTFDWPDILRQLANVVLPEFVAGGPSLVWTWFAVAWTYAILAVPILLLPAALNRRADPALRTACALRAPPSSVAASTVRPTPRRKSSARWSRCWRASKAI